MTKLLVTYDTVEIKDGIQGETCYELVADNAVANTLLHASSDDAAYRRWTEWLECLLLSAEMLRNHNYVMGSIKDIRPAEKI